MNDKIWLKQLPLILSSNCNGNIAYRIIITEQDSWYNDSSSMDALLLSGHLFHEGVTDVAGCCSTETIHHVWVIKALSHWRFQSPTKVLWYWKNRSCNFDLNQYHRTFVGDRNPQCDSTCCHVSGSDGRHTTSCPYSWIIASHTSRINKDIVLWATRQP